MAPDRDSLPNDVEAMKDLYLQLWTAVESKEAQVQRLIDQLRKHLRARFGRKAETMDEKQLLLAFAAMQQSGALPSEMTAQPILNTPLTAAAKRIEKAGHGRRALPQDLPRVEVVHDLPDADKTCTCGKAMLRIGEEVSEQLDYEPAQLRVIRHIRPKYFCPQPHDENGGPRFICREKPLEPIARGLAAPSLLAHLLVSKYDDHLPLYRQEEIFARQGIDLPRSTLCDWVQACADLCVPLYDELRRRVLKSRVIHTDDTNVPTQRRERASNACGDLEGDTNSKALRQTIGKGYLWVYIGDAKNPFTVFDYTPNRSRDGPKKFLGEYRGYLQCDAYSGYEGLFDAQRQRRRQIYEVGCWAHARRYFYDAQTSNRQDALEALAMIGRLYHVEHEAREAKLEDKALSAHRRKHAGPVLRAFKTWLQARAQAQTGILPKSELGKAIHYTCENFKALSRYIMRGYLNIDNNAAERALRNVVIGRKNWLFAGSDEGGKSAAVIYSLVESAKQCGANPYEYLRDVLARLPETRMSAVGELLPDAWLKAHA